MEPVMELFALYIFTRLDPILFTALWVLVAAAIIGACCVATAMMERLINRHNAVLTGAPSAKGGTNDDR
jgi:hypothetical protein